MEKKKNRIGLLGAAALALATSLGGAHQANALAPAASNVKHQNNKEGQHVEKKTVKPESERNKFGGFSGIRNPHKRHGKDYLNQRQHRKWLRSNPHMRNSKKAK
jgi:hypothetical protein